MLTTSFEQELLIRKEQGGKQAIGGSMATASVVSQVVSTTEGGPLKETQRALDMALAGDGYFVVQTPGGESLLTRNGGFQRDSNGTLILPGVGSVLGENGPIRLEDTNVTVGEGGSLMDGQGNRVDRLRVVLPQEGAVLEKRDNGLFALTNGAGYERVTGASVLQYHLEQSKVDLNL